MNNFLKRAKHLSQSICKYYHSLGVHIRITKVQIIPDLKRYIFKIELLPGTKVQAIFTYAPDIQAAMELHLFSPFRMGVSTFIAVSEFDVKENRLLKILGSPEFSNSTMQIPLALGYDLMGEMYLADLAKLLHLVVVGPSGTGKSVALQCIVLSIIVKCPVSSVRLILFDIGADSLSHFATVKHLYHPIVKDTETGIVVLESLVAEMDKRIDLGEDACRNLPFIICLIDEFDDTIAGVEDKQDNKRFTASLNSIIRRGRKAKIILILASHNPKLANVKVNISGIIPRISFQSTNHYNSSTALGDTGAQNLSGGGAMLFKSQDERTPKLLQGSYVTSAEIAEILENAPECYDDIDLLEIEEPHTIENSVLNDIAPKKDQQELADIIFWTLGQETISANKIQQRFKIGKRANDIIAAFNKMGIATNKYSNQPRKVIPSCIDDLSPEAVNVLHKYNYTTDQINKIFEIKDGGNLYDGEENNE